MRKNFCAAPWSGLSLDPDGQAKLCCVSKHRVELHEFDQVRTASKFIEIRQAFIDDQQHPSCDVCWQREKNGDVNSRRSIYQYDDFYHDLTTPNTFQLEHLDLRWSNTCNLNCVYCGPTFSSKWAELEGSKQSFRVFPTVSDSDLANLKILQLAGGEPLLIKENTSILERLLEVNPEVHIEITSNLTKINNNPIYKLLKQFNNVTWVVSFESIQERFDYIRNGAKWTDFYFNLNTLVMDFTDVQINMVYFPLSSFGIVDAINVALDITNPENIFLVNQFGGHGFDNLSRHTVQYINRHNQDRMLELPSILQTRLQYQLNLSITTQDQTNLPLYDKFDQLTNQNHRKIFTELYE